MLIRAKNLSLIRGQRLLFKKLNFTLNNGQAIYLKGHNGSGKTSLLKMLTGTLSSYDGELRVFDKSIKQFEPIDYQQLLYLGHKLAIKHELTVAENLLFNATIFDGIKPNNQQLTRALSQVGLAPFANQLAGKLSAGQKRLTMMARLWIAMDDNTNYKKLWLLDEPLTALDTTAVNLLQSQIDKHLSLAGGVILTSHQAFTLSSPMTTLTLGSHG